MKSYLLFICISILPVVLQGQCPTADFNLPDLSCAEQRLSTENISTSGTYNWDFCVGDLNTSPSASPILNNSSFLRARSLRVVNQNDQWYGFAISSTDNALYKLSFGNSLSNTPVFTNLGNFSGAFSNVFSFDIIETEGVYYAFVVNTGSNSITRLSFTTGLENLPTTQNLGNFGGAFSVATNINLKLDQNNYYAFITGNSTITRLNFGTSILNAAPLATAFTVTGSSGLRDVDFIKECDSWYGLILSYNNFKLFSISFSDGNLNGNMSFNEIITAPSVARFPASVKLLNDGGFYFGLIQSAEGNFYRVKFGEKISNFNTVFENLGLLGQSNQSFALEALKTGTEWFVFSIDLFNQNLVRIKFEKDCSVTVAVSIESSPEIVYTEPGVYFIGLEVNNEGSISHHRDTVIISSDIAPTISYTSQNACLTSLIQFTSESTSAGLAYTWDFGDGSNSSDENPAHTFSAAGDYEVTVTVDDGTCGNFTRQMITIYEEPAPDFTIPGGTICTNQQVNFMNDTPGEFDGLISYEWQVDGVTQSTEENFDFEFDAGGDKEIKLIASIPGCTVEMVKSLLDVREGAEPDFTFNDSCLGELVQFNNESVGSIVSYDWDFGNGITSTLENPALQFAEDGTFDVTLTTTNTDGCITSEVKAITVRPLPIVDFESELACENLATQLTDLTTIELDNLAEWEWNFGDGSAASTTQNPIHTFETSGDYSVQLQVTSTSGCIDSLTKVVSVLPAPVASFETNKICLGVPINFTDQSESVEGESITSWAWNLGGEFSSVQNPEVIFDDALDYDVSLTVTSENLCTSTVSEILSITPVAEVEFVVDNNCENEVTLLTDATAITGDVITSYQWTLDEQVFSTNSIAQFPLNEAEEYEAALLVETEKGCEYVGSQIFTINEAPSADFTLSVTFGTPPLLVDFSNDSEGAISYWWDFQDGNTSNDLNPSNEFLDLGEYVIELIATNEVGCSDSVSQRISVLDPEINLSLTNLSFIESGLNSFLSLTVENTGSITLDSFYVVLDLGGELLVREVVESRISPNQTVTEQLDLGFQNRRLNYICATVESTIDIGESNLEDNEACLFLDDIQSVIGPAMPNPSTGLVSFSIVTSINSNIEVSIFDNQGKEISDYSIAKNAGNNLLSIDLSSQKRGLYMVSIRVNGSSNLYRIMVRD